MLQTVARAREGALFLDRTAPGWASRINLGAFDVAYDTTCAIAQLFGGSYTHCDAHLKKHAVERGFYSKEAAETGELLSPSIRHEYGLLTSAWISEIQSRRNAKVRQEILAERSLPLAA